MTRAAIIEEVWRVHGDSSTNVVDVYINYLRRKIDSRADQPLIRTIGGVGYSDRRQSPPQLSFLSASL